MGALYGTVQLLQMFEKFVPVFTLVGIGQIQWLLMTANFIDTSYERSIWEKVENLINETMKQFPNDNIVLTGHSLGGGIAQVVAARRKLPALVFSAPGMLYNARRFGINIQAAKRLVMVIQPESDIVPMVDVQPGMVQRIECRDRNEASMQLQPVACHDIVKSTCEIWRVCGGDKRSFKHACSKYYKEDQLGGWYPQGD
eukprot:NODE_950_length_1298_cov_455.081255.p1 GENE.NODE_950_length_1298_cov_455.081255~~NODE_950_length_1298_cov_455.081255.p1  ORF type:complete len:199 (+),score=42.90 NODE_950_length_1298_cov_455.081255:3-599(+)